MKSNNTKEYAFYRNKDGKIEKSDSVLGNTGEMIWVKASSQKINMSNQQNENYEEQKHEFFLEGKDPLAVLDDLKNDKPSIATDKDNHNGDSNFEPEQ